MTAVLDAPADLTGLTDEQIAAMYDGADDATIAALAAECDRRDRAARIGTARQRAADKRKALYAEWREWAHADYLAAEARCCGNLLSREGERHTEEPMRLWSLPEHTARLWASEELNAHWDETDGHMTFARYLRQRAASRRLDREEHAMESSSSKRDTAVLQAKPREAGGRMDTEQTAPAGDRFADPEAWRAKSAARRAAIAKTAAGAGIRPATGTVAVRPPAGLGTRREIDGTELLDNFAKYWRRHAWFDSESKVTAVTLWNVAEHVRDASGALIFPEFAHLGFFSSEPGSGKTRCLQILQMLGANGPSIPIEPSEAAVALMLGKEHRLLLLDEGDVLFGSGNRKSAIRAILNSSYKKGGTWPRVRKGAVDDVKVDGGAVAGGFLDIVEKGTGSTLEALMQRFIKVRMSKPPAGTVIHKPREVVGEYQGRKVTGEHVATRLKELATTWAAQEFDAIGELIEDTPQLPPGVELRGEELWLAPLAIAQAADASAARLAGTDPGEPGRWTQLAWEACTDMSLYGGTPDVIGENLDMLADLTADWA